MIVAGTNVIASLVLPGPGAAVAERTLRADPVWASPLLWRSEFLNLLTVGVRAGRFDLALAARALLSAEAVVGGREFAVPGPAVLRAAIDTGLTAYDSEFVVLARDLQVPLLTLDRQVLEALPEIAVTPGDFTFG